MRTDDTNLLIKRTYLTNFSFQDVFLLIKIINLIKEKTLFPSICL